jgi:hypothetical protein
VRLHQRSRKEALVLWIEFWYSALPPYDRRCTEPARCPPTAAASIRELDQLKRENVALRDLARRLRTDPATIEGVARQQLGLVRDGEILVTIRDTK